MNIKRVDILWTQDAIEHIARHSVVPEEVECCIYQNAPRVFKVYRAGKERYIIYCQCPDSGRYLTIVVTPPKNGYIRIITARDMTSKEKAKYRR